MPSQLICPHCHRTLNKPPQLEVLGDIQQGGGGFIAFGDPDGHLSCPNCGFELRIGDIIDGKFDPKKAGPVATLVGYLIFIGIVVGLIAMCSHSG
jgi:hypothetical protein